MTNIPQKEITLIATYARVSTSNQENEGTIETQLSAVHEFAQKNSYTIVQEYLDNGWSGDTLIRPCLDQLRQDAKKKLWDAVLIYDPDRLARRYSYQELVADELREGGIEVLFVTTPPIKDGNDKLMYGVKGVFAEWERMRITERFRLGKLRKVKEGHLLVSTPLYGYRYILNNKETKEHGHYEINESEARVVRMIFTLIAKEGFTIRKVVRRLQELGIKPRVSKRGVWNTSTLTTLLRNKAYIGEAHWGSSYAVVPENPTNKEKYRKMKKSSRRIKPEEDWIASKIPVPQIIDRAVFERARQQLKTNFALCDRNKKNQYLLAGKIKCICGRTRGGEGPQHGKHLYYRCNDRNYSFPLPPTCSEGGINARIADKLVWDRISTLMSSPELLLAQADRLLKDRQDKAKDSFSDARVIEKEIAKLKAQEERYNKAYGAGLFSIEQLKEYAIPLRSQVASLELQIAKARQGKYQIGPSEIPDNNEIRAFAREAADELSSLSFAEKRGIITNILDTVVATQQYLEVSGQVPIPSHHVEYKTIHRYCRSSERRQIDAV